MRDTVFLDTAGLIAAIRLNDALHARAAAVFRDLAAESVPLLTTDWVLAEFLAGAALPPLRRRAADATEQLMQSRAVRILPATRRSWLAAFDLYRHRADKEWSLVDCASILACRMRSVNRVFTHDRHFAQAGLEVLLA